MPRKARTDAPGALHHIIVRGIERSKIFLDDFDRDNFLKRLGNVVSRNRDTLFCLGLDSKPRAFVAENRHHRHCHGHAQALDRLCGKSSIAGIVAMVRYFRTAINPFYLEWSELVFR